VGILDVTFNYPYIGFQKKRKTKRGEIKLFKECHMKYGNCYILSFNGMVNYIFKYDDNFDLGEGRMLWHAKVRDYCYRLAIVVYG
jgi:hypothetical protein